MEGALCENKLMRHFAGWKQDRLPDKTTILNFLHFPVLRGLGKALFIAVYRG